VGSDVDDREELRLIVRRRGGVVNDQAKAHPSRVRNESVRVVRAEDIHTVAASLIAMLRRETAGIVIG
jgi:hypothetical protein